MSRGRGWDVVQIFPVHILFSRFGSKIAKFWTSRKFPAIRYSKVPCRTKDGVYCIIIIVIIIKTKRVIQNSVVISCYSLSELNAVC